MLRILFILIILNPLLVKSQILGTEAFMKGYYVELGINGYRGCEGAQVGSISSPIVPPGYHFRSTNPVFGFLANPQMDGWLNYDGDFFSPGTSENGWGIEVGTAKGHNNSVGNKNIEGNIASYSYAGGISTVIWQGNYDSLGYNLDFTITYTLHDTANFYTTKVDVYNGSASISDFYYYRNIDPDNSMMLSGDYVTTNTIVQQGSPIDTAIVKAETFSPWYSCYTLYSTDPDARVTVGGFSNRDGSDIWTGTPAYLFETTGYTNTLDCAISLAWKVSPFPNGTTESFEFKTIFAGPGPAAPVASFSAPESVCAGDCFTFSNSSIGAITYYEWIFTGGDIDSSNIMNPTVCYDSTGTYEVTLIVEGIGGSDTSFMLVPVTVNYPAIASFSMSDDTAFIPSTDITFTNNSTNASGFEWSFGDGGVSTDINPIYIYSTAGTYNVMLIAIDTCGNDTTYSSVVVINTTGTNDTENKNRIKIYPNPASEFIEIIYNRSLPLGNLKLINCLGEVVYSHRITNSMKVNVQTIPQGIYYLQVYDNNLQLCSEKVIVSKH